MTGFSLYCENEERLVVLYIDSILSHRGDTYEVGNYSNMENGFRRNY